MRSRSWPGWGPGRGAGRGAPRPPSRRLPRLRLPRHRPAHRLPGTARAHRPARSSPDAPAACRSASRPRSLPASRSATARRSASRIAERMACSDRAASRRWSATRSCPSSTTTGSPRPPRRSSTTRNVIRRCAGRRESSNASGGISTPRSSRTAWANVVCQDGAASPARTVSAQDGWSASQPTTAAATSGAGTSCTRTGLGSARIVATASSACMPGTRRSNPSGTTRSSTWIGMCTVTPSCSVPGS